MINFNPSISLLSAFIYSILVSFSAFEFYYIFPIIFLLFCQKKHLFLILRKLLFLNFFIFILFLTLLYSSSLNEALNIYIRANAILLFNIALFFTSKGYDIVRALNSLNFPSSVVSSTYFTLKMIEFLTKDFTLIKNSLKARGFKADTSLFTYETFGNIMGLLFVKAIRKSYSLRQTFIYRGFKNKIYLNEDFIVQVYDKYLIFTVLFTILTKVIYELFF
ncbi:CbiQ family ECF transporter T component [Arcobacter sp. YIC-310]|uniref:CbiQ family ECF transporter T component n=1 Tax=Arcobacter sp. YIC-310 TaxID=3376632 RepID=UPI003C1554EE